MFPEWPKRPVTPERKKVKGVTFEAREGRVFWQLEFEGGSVGQWEETSVSSSDQDGFQKLKQRLERENGIRAEERRMTV